MCSSWGLRPQSTTDDVPRVAESDELGGCERAYGPFERGGGVRQVAEGCGWGDPSIALRVEECDEAVDGLTVRLGTRPH
jgi:hypothetical protein